MIPLLPPDDLLTLHQHIRYGRHDPVERRRAHGHHDTDGFFGDGALRPDPIWMGLRNVASHRPLSAITARIRNAFAPAAPCHGAANPQP